MKILFRREQTTGKLSRVNFKLWANLELEEAEQALVKRYRFDEAVLIEAIQPGLVRNAAAFGLLGLIPGSILVGALGIGGSFGIIVLVACVVGLGYWRYHQKRETIFVRDLLHGRHFTCDSVVELARKEAWLQTVSSFLRQVMESAKHWDGDQVHEIEALPKDEARQVILKGL